MTNEKNKVSSAKKIASSVLGIISILFATFYYISLPAGILAIMLGVKALKVENSGMSKAGIILGIIGLTLCVLIYGIVMSVIFISNWM